MSSFSFIVRVECTVFLTFPRSVDAFRYRRLHIARALRIHHAATAVGLHIWWNCVVFVQV